ncbi:hypothetical protein ON010_g9648 [Phytophthora cinnamomi]|nr:hypothetical protein ON010_g9648 [Phytophthora cinnamomi]
MRQVDSPSAVHPGSAHGTKAGGACGAAKTWEASTPSRSLLAGPMTAAAAVTAKPKRELVEKCPLKDQDDEEEATWKLSHEELQ